MSNRSRKFFRVLKRISCIALSGIMLGACSISGQPATQYAPLTNAISIGAADAAKGINQFALSFCQELLSTQGDESNFVCSPFSAWLPLAALVNATEEDARPALLETIGEAGLNVDDLNAIASGVMYDLTGASRAQYTEEGETPHNPLAIANAILVDQGVQLNQRFIDTFAQYYGGAAMRVDFSSSQAAETVNDWASQNTDGLISEIVREFDPDTIAAIANAIYFSDRWEWEFDPQETEVKSFRTPSGTVDASFMQHEGPMQPYYEDSDLQAARLDFLSGGSLYILLPKQESASELLSSLSVQRFDAISNEMEPRQGLLCLPRFKIESPVMNLTDSLRTLGIPLFSGADPVISALINNTDPLFISDAVQRAVIDVDEKGTTAAAVTVVSMAAGGAPITETPVFEMQCDHPFVFILTGASVGGTDQILFTGILNNPSDNTTAP